MKTIRDILWDFHVATTKARGFPPYDQALKEIHDIIVESLSEENLINIGYYEDWGTYNEGFEACRDEVKANLLKILGGK